MVTFNPTSLNNQPPKNSIKHKNTINEFSLHDRLSNLTMLWIEDESH
jgi:hypothetical protein